MGLQLYRGRLFRRRLLLQVPADPEFIAALRGAQYNKTWGEPCACSPTRATGLTKPNTHKSLVRATRFRRPPN